MQRERERGYERIEERLTAAHFEDAVDLGDAFGIDLASRSRAGGHVVG